MPKCKICQSNCDRIADIKHARSFYRCESCGFIYLDESHLIDTVQEQRHYEKHNNSFECSGYVEMFERFIQNAIVPYEKNLHTALEFGCGTGPVLAELLSRRGLEVDKYDLYFYPKKVYEGKVYDLITSTEVFEHLKNPLEIFELLAAHLAPQGYMALMTNFAPETDEAFLKWWYIRDFTHISFFTPKSFEVMAEKAGLTMVKHMNNNVVIFQKC